MAASSSCSCKLTDSFTFGEFPSFFIIFLENRKHILLNENENFLQNTLKDKQGIWIQFNKPLVYSVHAKEKKEETSMNDNFPKASHMCLMTKIKG